MPYCPSCGTKTTGGDFCTACGAQLHVDAESASIDQHEKGPVGFAVSYIFANGWTPFLLSALCIAFSWLVLPYFLLYGYAYRLGRSAIRRDPVPRGYDDLIGILTDGVVFFVATIPIMIALALLAGIPILGAIAFESIGLALLGILLYMGVVYVGAGVLPTFLATGSLSSTYRGLAFLRFAGTIQHFKAVVLIVGISLSLSFVLLFFSIALIVTIVGIVFIPFVYLGTVTLSTLVPFTLFAYYYLEAEETNRVDPVQDPSRLRSEF